MSSFEDSYKSQLQGVSQQLARERLDGQVSAQDNMLSDTVTNLRRRPGAVYAYNLSVATATPESVLAWNTDIAGTRCHVVLNCVDGAITILDALYNVLATLPTSTYLTTTDTGTIQVATVGDEFILANTAKLPALGASSTGTSPDIRGFFYIKAGAFSKLYEVHLQTSSGTITATYTTPNGTGAGDAALSTPEHIAGELVTSLTAYGVVTLYQDAAYVYIQNNATITGLVVSSPSGTNYVIASGAAYLRLDAELPSRLPSQAGGFIISTGELRALKYYQYDATKLAWLEVGNYASPLSITNVPVSITKVAGVWTLQTNTWEGRLSGDDDTNPAPAFIKRGITGVSNYQGRLVILSGSMVNMSASNKTYRFYRSTVSSILDSDCIEIGASAASSAAYRYAVPFQKDLLLFSEKYQAVVPGGATAITPRTASVVVTSTYDSDMSSKPTPVGRTLMYSAPRSKDFFGLLEMEPSGYIESQYLSADSTAHLPKYMAGRCKFGVSSSVANMVLFAPTGDRYSLIVHEYTWSGDKKVQQAWHRWTFRYKVAAAYFSGQVVYVLFVNNGKIVACTIDPRSGQVSSTSDTIPHMDMVTFVDVVDGVVQYPAWLTAFDSTAKPDVRLSVATGSLAGSLVGGTVVGSDLHTVISFQNGRVGIGFPYTSLFSPTPPMKKDGNGVQISSNKMTVLRFMVGTKNSTEYDVHVSDRSTEAVESDPTSPLYFGSAELSLGSSLVGGDSIAIVPARTEAASTQLILSTDGLGELNIVSLEYVARYNTKVRRAYHGG